MHVKYLECISCHQRYPQTKIRYFCDCGESLRIIYDYSTIKKKLSWDKLRKRPFGHWRYRELYPLMKDKYIVSLDEGGTSLIASKNIRENLYFKFEGNNPTGSFKDRGSTLEISKAKELGAKKVVVASTGNMGSSVAAYAAAANIKLIVYLAKQAVPEKVKQIKRFGAEVILAKGDYTQAARLAVNEYKKKGTYLLGDYAYRGEGEKSVAFEIIDEILPDYIICPMGNGTLISGMWRGLNELKMIGLLKNLPILIGVQSTGCAPIVTAWKTKKPLKFVSPKTIATAIACGDPSDGEPAKEAIIASKGKAIAVTDKEILKARKLLALKEGLDVEPSSATCLAALQKIKLPKNKKIVCVLTGHGLKDASNF